MEVFYGNLEKGSYELKMQLMSTKAREEYPEFNLFLNNEKLETVEANYDAFAPIIIEFKVQTLGLNSVEIGLTKDFWDPETGEDRNIFIRNLEVYKKSQ